MIFDKKYSKKLEILLTSLLIFLISGCGIYKPVDARKVDPNVKKESKKISKKEEVIDYLVVNKKVVVHLSLQHRTKCGEPL